MKIIKILVLIVLFLFQVVYSQNSTYNFFGAGARAVGMGSAFVGIADDATAITWNPAGLTQLQRPEVSTVLKLNSGKYEWKYKYSPEDDEENPNSNFRFGFGSIVYPISFSENKFWIGICYQNVLDRHNDYSSGGYNYSDTRHVETISSSLAYKLNNEISIGVTANYWMGGGEYKRIVDYNHDKDYSWKDNSYSGFNFLLGALFNYEPFKIGVSLKSPFTLTNEYYYNDKNQVDDKAKYKIDMPMMLGVGISYRLTENLLVAADYEFRAFKDKEYSIVYDDGDEFSGKVNNMNENTHQIRIGAEYSLITDFAVIPIRLGYRNEPTQNGSSKVVNEADIYTKREVGDAVTFGTGLSFEKFSVDFAYEYLISKIRKQNYDIPENSYDFTSTKNTFLLSVIYYF